MKPGDGQTTLSYNRTQPGKLCLEISPLVTECLPLLDGGAGGTAYERLSRECG